MFVNIHPPLGADCLKQSVNADHPNQTLPPSSPPHQPLHTSKQNPHITLSILLDNNIMPKMSQNQRKENQQQPKRKCQICKNHIPKHTPMLILNKRRKHE